MTFEVKNHQLNNRLFVDTLKKLGNESLDVKVAWNIKRMLKQFDNALNKAGEGYVKIVNEYCKRTEDGKIIEQQDDEGNDIPNSFTFENDEKEEGFKAAMGKFMMEEYTIESNKLNPNDFEGATLSATDLAVLEPVIEE